MAAGSGFPEGHPNFQGVLPPAIGPLAETLSGHDLVLVAGSSVFPYYPYIPGELLGPDTELVAITSDPDEAARAPMGEAIVADVKLTLEALLEAVPESERDAPDPRPDPEPPADADPPLPGAVFAALAEVFPEDGIVVLESPSSTLSLRNRLRISRPGSYFFGAGGGLGFGLAAAVGVQIAQPKRPVVCVLGEGSMQYAVTALWSAVAHEAPVTVLVLRNSEYAILKWFAEMEGVEGAPGLDLPALDSVAVAGAYGVNAARADGEETLAQRSRTRSHPVSRGSSRSQWRPGWRWTRPYLTRRIRGWPSGARTCGSSSSACSSCQGLWASTPGTSSAGSGGMK